jgi:hypothetical protein
VVPALEGNRQLHGSEGVRTVRSRSDGGGSKGVRASPSGSKGGPSGFEWVALTGRPGHVRRACAKRYPAVRAVRSESDGEKQTGETNVREAASLLSMAVRSPELRQARARVAPGSPKLGRGEEGATTNSMAGKRP